MFIMIVTIFSTIIIIDNNSTTSIINIINTIIIIITTIITQWYYNITIIDVHSTIISISIIITYYDNSAQALAVEDVALVHPVEDLGSR